MWVGAVSVGAQAERVGRVALEPADRVAAARYVVVAAQDPDVPSRYSASHVASPPISLQLSATLVLPDSLAPNPGGARGVSGMEWSYVVALTGEEYSPHPDASSAVVHNLHIVWSAPANTGLAPPIAYGWGQASAWDSLAVNTWKTDESATDGWPEGATFMDRSL